MRRAWKVDGMVAGRGKLVACEVEWEMLMVSEAEWGKLMVQGQERKDDEMVVKLGGLHGGGCQAAVSWW